MKESLMPLLPRLGVAFRQGVRVRVKDQDIGKGLFERDLEKAGFKKKELRELVAEGVIDFMTTAYQGGWRNTYVLRDVQIGADE